MNYMRLLVPVTGNILLAVAIYRLDKYSFFKKLSYWQRQIVIGLLFGAMSAFASEYGFEIMGAVANVRDASPLCAGLIFGAPAGIIAGFTGGVYRWFSVYWGAGTYTRVACSIATALAGVLTALMRKYMFDDKKPVWSYGIIITILCEIIHMLLIFITNMYDAEYAFQFVQKITVPMVLANTFAVAVALVMVSLLSREGKKRKKGEEQIAQTFQRWLLVCIVAACCLTSVFTYTLQNKITTMQIRDEIILAINDVYADINDASNENLLAIARAVKAEYEANPEQTLESLMEKYNVSEINIVNSNNEIKKSTMYYLVGYNMSRGGEKSKEFTVLNQGETEYVQEYGPTSYNYDIYRKYAGVSLDGGGFIQVGYDAKHFRDDINGRLLSAIKNRHIGRTGIVAICDENFNFITNDENNGKNISEVGLHIDPATMPTDTIYKSSSWGMDFLFAYLETEGYYIIGTIPEDEAMFMREVSVYTNVFMIVLIFAVLFVFIYILIKKVIIKNIEKINSSLSQITDGNLDVVVDVRSNQEFSSLSDDINSTVETLKNYIAEAAARIDRELEYAKQIQLSALPTNFTQNTEKSRFDIFAQMIAAKEVGGDFYDFYMLDENRVAFVVADVSGKGIPAAMFMMTSKTIIKDLAERGLDANEIFTQANEKLCENNESGMFVTAWMGILDLNTGRLQYANAGHNPPLVMRNGGDFEYLKFRPGFVLAGMEGIRYRLGETILEKGDRIFLYTDGVSEATDTHQQLYGEERLQTYLNGHKTLAPQPLLEQLKNNIDEFVGEAPQFDDITMLVLDYKGDGEMLTEKIFPAKTEALYDVLGFVEEKLEQAECSMKAQTAIAIALEEVFVNVANYAYGDAEGTVKIGFGFEKATRMMTLVVSDQGIPFDPLKKQDPDITLSAEERDIGGLGIFITKKTMDSVVYRYENGENILTMKKTI